MADGKLVMTPADARARANEMKTIANNLDTLLRDVKAKMEEVDDEGTGMYQGNKKPAQLRTELNAFSATFYQAYDQIIKSADDIILIATTAEAE